MAVPGRISNGAALLQAAKGILPYAVLFYAIDFFIWYSGPPDSPANDANLIFNIAISSLFIGGFLLIGFFRARGSQKAAMEMPRVVVVQQPVYMQGPPPAYGYPPPPGYPPYGYQAYGQPPPALPQQAAPAPSPAQPPQDTWVALPPPPPPPPEPPAPARKRPPEGAP